MLILIRRDDERYPNIGGIISPNELVVNGTMEQAEWVARTLSSYYAGCDYLFYCKYEDET